MEEEAQALVRGAFSKEAKPAADVKKQKLQRQVQQKLRMEKNVQRKIQHHSRI